MDDPTCEHCATPLIHTSKFGPAKRYCNAKCRNAASRARAASDGRRDQQLTKRYAKRRAETAARRARLRRCAQCAVEFSGIQSHAIYCSPACKNRAFKLRRKSTAEGRAYLVAQEQKRRAARKTTEIESIIAADIFERNIETLRKLGHEGWRRLWLDDTPKG